WLLSRAGITSVADFTVLITRSAGLLPEKSIISHGKIRESDDMPGDIVPCDHPVAVPAMQPFWQDFEFARDRLVGIGNAAGIRAPDKPLDQRRDLDSLLLEYLEIPDNVDRGPRGDQGDPVHFLF